MDLVALKAEIQTDPATLGYAGKNHEQISDLLNSPIRTPNRDTISGGMLASCLDRVEFAALPASDREWLGVLAMADELTLFASLKQDIRAILGTNSKAKFNQNIVRQGSRADELGLGRVTPSDVANALRS